MKAPWRKAAFFREKEAMKKHFAIAAAAALILIFSAGVLHAEKLSGDYEIRQNGQLIGAEKWTIEFSKDGSYVSESMGSTKQTDGDNRIQIDDSTQLRAGLSGTFDSYEREVSVGGLPRRLSLEFSGVKFISRFHSGQSIVERNMAAPGESTTVDSGVFHHYNILLHYARVHRGFSKPIPVIIPSEQSKTTAYVDDRGEDSINIGGKRYRAHRYFIDMGLFGVQAWADEKDRLIKIHIPTTGFSVILAGYRGQAAAAPKTDPAPRWAVEKTEATFPAPATIEGVKEFKLNAVIRRPMNQTGKLPAVIFINDTGPQDAEGVDPVTGLNTLTGEFCDALASSGYIVVSWDDRGIGKSEGDMAAASLDILEKDALAALDHIKLFPGADGKRIALAGLGEGAGIALRAAAKRPEVKAVVALSPSPIKLADLAKEQLRRRMEADGGMSSENIDGHPVMVALRQAAETTKDFTVIGGRPVYLDVYRQWLKNDPVADLKSVKAPLLHVTCANDNQIFPDLNKDFIGAGKQMHNYNHKNFKDLDHYLIKGRGTLGSYSDPDRVIDAEAVAYVVRWLGEKLK